jgi:hypothetical protein
MTKAKRTSITQRGGRTGSGRCYFREAALGGAVAGADQQGIVLAPEKAEMPDVIAHDTAIHLADADELSDVEASLNGAGYGMADIASVTGRLVAIFALALDEFKASIVHDRLSVMPGCWATPFNGCFSAVFTAGWMSRVTSFSYWYSNRGTIGGEKQLAQ